MQLILSKNLNIPHQLYKIVCHLFAATVQQDMSASQTYEEDYVWDDA